MLEPRGFCLLGPSCHTHSALEVEPCPGRWQQYACEKSPPPTDPWFNPACLPPPQPTVQAYPTQALSGSKAQESSLQEALGLESEFLTSLPAVASLVAVGNIRCEALPLSGAVRCRCVTQHRVLLPHTSIITAQTRPNPHLATESKPRGTGR